MLLYGRSAFESLQHLTITDALRAIGVCGNLLGYIQEFLSDRTSRVRIVESSARLDL